MFNQKYDVECLFHNACIDESVLAVNSLILTDQVQLHIFYLILLTVISRSCVMRLAGLSPLILQIYRSIMWVGAWVHHLFLMSHDLSLNNVADG